jgi:hypothetical protein
MIDWYPWVVTTHVLGAFGFVLAHGVSAFAAFRLRRATDATEARLLLGLSSTSLSLAYGSLLLLLIAGVAAGFMGGWWGHAWIWISVGLLLVIAIAMYAVGTRYYVGVRQVLAADGPGAMAADRLAGSTDTVDLARLLESPRASALAAIGGIGLALLVTLMELKPG